MEAFPLSLHLKPSLKAHQIRPQNPLSTFDVDEGDEDSSGSFARHTEVNGAVDGCFGATGQRRAEPRALDVPIKHARGVWCWGETRVSNLA
ncbi:hypothetical protein CXB51_024485 [Gossypium anomalum]|uniref:Uncharacterized protein n=1 Tax=Gossypium anomalum TaxID=47600 RepID=A0A8J5YM74_9ROSI|nr:hypothetical protein CXB51_024485 [Gossypium anomalum]